MLHTRSAAVAGSFYPEDKDQLVSKISQLYEQAGESEYQARICIAPHAGYIYSGAIQAQAYRALNRSLLTAKCVVLLGPAHHYPLRNLAVSSHQYFATPLGNIACDTDRIQDLSMNFKVVGVQDEAHTMEHSLEIHLPFLQTLAPDIKILPILVGQSDAAEVAQVIETFWHNPDICIVISSDLSHFHPYDEAQKIDQKTTELIENKEFSALTPERACGCYAIRGLLHLAKKHKAQVKCISQCNSGDTLGDKARVVGYGAYVIT